MIGFIIGLLVGATIGAVGMAMLAVSARAEEHAARAREQTPEPVCPQCGGTYTSLLHHRVDHDASHD